jgi:cytochrome oxidase assembly protein ShyY1
MYQVMLYNKFLSFVVVWSSVSIMSEIIMPFSSLAQET